MKLSIKATYTYTYKGRMELRRDTENGSQRKPCLCSLANMDDDDVVMHDANCSYCDGGLLETAFLEDNESDSWSCLMVGDVESKVEEIGGVKVRTEEKQTVRCQEDDVQFKSEDKVNVKQVVLEDKETQLDKYIAALQRNNARLLQRFHEVEEDKKRAERRDEDWKRKRRTTVTISQRAYRSVSLVEKQRKKSRRRNRRH